MKKIIYVVSAGLIVGAVAVSFYFRNSKKKKTSNKACEYENRNDKVEKEKDGSSANVIITWDEPVYEDVKSSAIGSIYSRHESGAAVMSDSVDAIRENIRMSEITNDEIDDISAELNRMISED